MPITYSPAVVRELNQRLVMMFDLGAGDAAKRSSPVMELCYVDTSDTAQNVYTLVDSDFQLRDRGDSAEMIVDGVKLYEAALKDGKKYKIIQVDLDKLEDDKVGQYKAVFYKLGMTQALGPTRLVEDTMLAATSTAPGGNNGQPGNYDGVPLISTAHPVRPFDAGSPTWANKLVRGAGLTFATFQEAYAAMENFPSEDGRIGGAGSKATILVTHAGNRQIANDICSGALPFGQQGGGNPWKGEIRPMIVPFLSTDANFSFELIDDRSSLERPYIYQERRALRLVPLFSSHEDSVVMKTRKLEWMVDGRLGAGYGYANKVIRVVTA
jgi:phage major head subunit gpT-like protein